MKTLHSADSKVSALERSSSSGYSRYFMVGIDELLRLFGSGERSTSKVKAETKGHKNNIKTEKGRSQSKTRAGKVSKRCCITKKFGHQLAVIARQRREQRNFATSASVLFAVGYLYSVLGSGRWIVEWPTKHG